MGKSVKDPKRFIISCRVSDEEMAVLQERAKEAGTNISNLLRLSLDISSANQQMAG